jgi:hypothetical protein
MAIWRSGPAPELTKPVRERKPILVDHVHGRHVLSFISGAGGKLRTPVDEMDPAYQAIPPLHAIFDGARRFGLSDAEVWRAFDECVDEAGPDATVADYVEELTGELARRILRKQRCSATATWVEAK